tara:strand:+ start:1407 stop:2150 length:744 start_codon:yes stop_codon:yes gene_type:complete
MNKSFHFVCGLPRSGNTLLGTLVNQNPNISFGGNSILAEVLYKLSLLKNTENFQVFPDENSYNNILNGVFDSYYKDHSSKNILIRDAWGTPANLFILKSIIDKPKFIMPYRPVLECLASFIKIENPTDIELRCEQLMQEDGMIGKNLWSIKNIINTKQNNLVIHYKHLIDDPEKQIKRIHKFLNIKYKKIKTKKFEQFSINNISYNDTILNAPFHKIRTDKIQRQDYKISSILSKKIIKKYSNLDVL